MNRQPVEQDLVNLKQLKEIHEKYIITNQQELSHEIAKRLTRNSSTPTRSSAPGGAPLNPADEHGIQIEMISAASTSARPDDADGAGLWRALAECLLHKMEDLYFSKTLGIRPLTGRWLQKGVVEQVLEIINRDEQVKLADFTADQIVHAMRYSFQMRVLDLLDSSLAEGKDEKDIEALFILLENDALLVREHRKFTSHKTNIYILANVFTHKYTDKQRIQVIESLQPEELQAAIRSIHVYSHPDRTGNALITFSGKNFRVSEKPIACSNCLLKECCRGDKIELLKSMLMKVGEDFVFDNEYPHLFFSTSDSSAYLALEMLLELYPERHDELIRICLDVNHNVIQEYIIRQVSEAERVKHFLTLMSEGKDIPFKPEFLAHLAEHFYTTVVLGFISEPIKEESKYLVGRLIGAAIKHKKTPLRDLVNQVGNDVVERMQEMDYSDVCRFIAEEEKNVSNEKEKGRKEGFSLFWFSVKRGCFVAADKFLDRIYGEWQAKSLTLDIKAKPSILCELMDMGRSKNVLFILSHMPREGKAILANDSVGKRLLRQAICAGDFNIVTYLYFILNDEKNDEKSREVIRQAIEDGISPLRKAFKDTKVRGNPHPLAFMLEVLDMEADLAIEDEDTKQGGETLLYLALAKQQKALIIKLWNVMGGRLFTKATILMRAINGGLMPLRGGDHTKIYNELFFDMMKALGEKAAEAVAMEDDKAAEQANLDPSDKTHTLLYMALTSHQFDIVHCLFDCMVEEQSKLILMQLKQKGIHPLDLALQRKEPHLADRILRILGPDAGPLKADWLVRAMHDSSNIMDESSQERYLSFISTLITIFPEVVNSASVNLPVFVLFLMSLLKQRIWGKFQGLFRQFMMALDEKAKSWLINTGFTTSGFFEKAAKEGNVEAFCYMLAQLPLQARPVFSNQGEMLELALKLEGEYRLAMVGKILGAFPYIFFSNTIMDSIRHGDLSLKLLVYVHNYCDREVIRLMPPLKQMPLLKESINRGETPSEQACEEAGCDYQDCVPSLEYYTRPQPFTYDEWQKIKPLYVLFVLYNNNDRDCSFSMLPYELVAYIASISVTMNTQKEGNFILTNEGWRRHLLLSSHREPPAVEEVGAQVEEFIDDSCTLEMGH